MEDIGPPQTTIPPFNDPQALPSCAVSCEPLYAANGACVPPALEPLGAEAYESCFCLHGDVAPLATATTGVCDNACQGEDLGQVASWFRGLCGVDQNAGNAGNNNGGDGNGGNGQDGNGNGQGGPGNGPAGRPTFTGQAEYSGNGGDWLSNHWQWVVFLVVIVVAIAGIWIGACIWRRRYLKKKERQRTWAQKQSGSASRPSWGPGGANDNQIDSRPQLNSAPPSDDPSAPGIFMPGTAVQQPPLAEKGGKKSRWAVRERS